MKIKVLTYPGGKVGYITEGDKYSKGANLSDGFGLEINGEKPIKEEVANVPDDFWEKADTYEFERERHPVRQEWILKVKRKKGKEPPPIVDEKVK